MVKYKVESQLLDRLRLLEPLGYLNQMPILSPQFNTLINIFYQRFLVVSIGGSKNQAVPL